MSEYSGVYTPILHRDGLCPVFRTEAPMLGGCEPNGTLVHVICRPLHTNVIVGGMNGAG